MTNICVQEPALIIIIAVALLSGLLIGAVCTVWVLELKHHERRRV